MQRRLQMTRTITFARYSLSVLMLLLVLATRSTAAPVSDNSTNNSTSDTKHQAYIESYVYYLFAATTFGLILSSFLIGWIASNRLQIFRRRRRERLNSSTNRSQAPIGLTEDTSVSPSTCTNTDTVIVMEHANFEETLLCNDQVCSLRISYAGKRKLYEVKKFSFDQCDQGEELTLTIHEFIDSLLRIGDYYQKKPLFRVSVQRADQDSAEVSHSIPIYAKTTLSSPALLRIAERVSSKSKYRNVDGFTTQQSLTLKSFEDRLLTANSTIMSVT